MDWRWFGKHVGEHTIFSYIVEDTNGVEWVTEFTVDGHTSTGYSFCTALDGRKLIIKDKVFENLLGKKIYMTGRKMP